MGQYPIPWSRLHQPAVLVGNRLYWILLGTSDILEFDLDGQSLAMIQKPEDPRVTNNSGIQALRVEGNKLGLCNFVKAEHPIVAERDQFRCCWQVGAMENY